MKRLSAIGVVAWFMLAGTADAQVLGTYRWQLQPYCNTVIVVVTQIGSVYRLEGTEDRCGAGQQSSVTGTAYQNPDGTIGMGFNIVSPGGVSSHVTATIAFPSLTGTWTEQGVPSGNFVLINGPGTGSPKPARSAVVASATRNDNFTFAQGAPVFVPLDAPTTPPAATALSFTLPTAEQLVLTYSAECAVGGTGFETWLDIDVLLNGTVLSPTDSPFDAFCTSNGTAAADGWTRTSITVVVPAVAGTNTIQIRATIQSSDATTSGWLGDSALVVQR